VKWIALLLMFCMPAAAQPLSEKQKESLSNVEMELSICVAYFNFAKNCAPDEMKEDVKAFDPTIKSMMDMITRIGKNIGMTPDAAFSRIKMAMEQQRALIEGKCVNFSSLITRYAARCKQVGENLDTVYDEYMNK
jgi:hypothetical protein